MVEDVPALVERLTRLTWLQGRERVAAWISLAEAGDFRALAGDLIREHYDPRYAKVRARREAAVTPVEAQALDEAGIEALAVRVAALAAG